MDLLETRAVKTTLLFEKDRQIFKEMREKYNPGAWGQGLNKTIRIHVCQ